uniref:ATP synthase complex subunit 8 n=1 Tax=Muraenesox cinereus TaxID=7946 RepID=A0A891T725_MURCI|nr:ATP synthase F0 subunit 8 [Muraenesox cinereus]QRM91339.1 ATP synthase F0 subunit 8 [Muraenesox cinereus]
MPQLILYPWLGIFMFSWLVFLTIIFTKIMNHTFNNQPNPLSTKKPEVTPWDWPWY